MSDLKFQVSCVMIIGLALLSCNGKKVEPPNPYAIAQEERRKVLDEVRARYPRINEFSSSDNRLTIALQERVEVDPLFILEDFDLYDVSHVDSLCLVSLRSGSYRWDHEIMADLTCDCALAKTLARATAGDDTTALNSHFQGPGIVAARLESVQRMKLFVSATAESVEEGRCYAQVELDKDLPLLLKGELLEFR